MLANKRKLQMIVELAPTLRLGWAYLDAKACLDRVDGIPVLVWCAPSR